MRDVAPIASFVPGSFPWHVWHDRHPAPFAFLKNPELHTPAVDEDLAALDGRSTGVLLHAALWGNQADLGFRIGVAAAHGEVGPSGRLVADDSAALLSLLAAGTDVVC